MISLVLLCGLAHAGDAAVRWIGEGRLMVDEHMLVDVATGKVSPLLYPTRRPSPGGGHHKLPLAISPSGQVALIDAVGQGVFLGLLDGPLVSRATLPDLHSDGSVEDYLHAALWVDDRRLLLSQADPADGSTVCALLDAAALSWSEPIDCPPSDFALTYDFVPGPRGWTAVLSGGEGMSAVLLVRWDPELGARDVRTLEIDPAVGQLGGVQVFFTGSGDVRLMTPCGAGGEECEEPRGRWLYAWLPSGDLRFLRKGLPEGVVPSATSDDFAWIEAERVCLGDPDGGRRCAPLSTARSP